MAVRLGPGPVFVYESIVAARRWQVYAQRSLFLLALLAALLVVWWTGDANVPAGAGRSVLRQLARLGQQFYDGIAGVQVTLILILAPAATAGAVCLDRARGSLTHMLVTDLSDREIVLGKLAARLAPVVALVAATLPLLEIASLLGGIIPDAVVSLSVITLALGLLGCSLAIAFSVRVRKTHEVLMAVYGLFLIWILSAWLWRVFSRGGTVPGPPPWFEKLNPFILVYAPYSWPGFVGPADVALFLALTLAASGLSLGFAVATLRKELTGEAPARKRLRWVDRLKAGWRRLADRLPGPSLDGNPVLWREWHRNRPSGVAFWVWTVYTLATVLGSVYGFYEMVDTGVRSGAPNFVVLINSLSVSFGLLFLSVAAPTALAEERTRGSLDVLLATPLSTASIVLAKWWGVYRVVPRIALLPAIGTAVYVALAQDAAVRPGLVQAPITWTHRLSAFAVPVLNTLSAGALVTSVGLALATFDKKAGRAVALSAAFYVGLSLLSIIFVASVLSPLLRSFTPPGIYYQNFRWLETGLLTVSPFGAQIIPLESLVQNNMNTNNPLSWVTQQFVIFAEFAAAAALLAVTVFAFDGKMERVPEMPEAFSRRVNPRVKPRTLREVESVPAS